jgi:hypothetical protein
MALEDEDPLKHREPFTSQKTSILIPQMTGSRLRASRFVSLMMLLNCIGYGASMG